MPDAQTTGDEKKKKSSNYAKLCIAIGRIPEAEIILRARTIIRNYVRIIIRKLRVETAAAAVTLPRIVERLSFLFLHNIFMDILCTAL